MSELCEGLQTPVVGVRQCGLNCRATPADPPATQDCRKPLSSTTGRSFVGGYWPWSEERGVRLEFIQPGKPVQNAYVESFNGRLRDECLNANWFTNLRDARRKVETWRLDYNQQVCVAHWTTCRLQIWQRKQRR